VRSLLARAVTLATVLVAVVLLAVALPWLWWDASERVRDEALSQAGLVAAAVAVDADPETLYRMKRNTVRLKDRADAALLRERFGLEDE
jgi:hypothetical protein